MRFNKESKRDNQIAGFTFWLVFPIAFPIWLATRSNNQNQKKERLKSIQKKFTLHKHRFFQREKKQETPWECSSSHQLRK